MSSVSLFSILAVALLVGVVAGVVVLIKGQRRGRQGTDPTCGRCGYNLTGSESNRCPECGTLFIEAGVTLGRSSPKKARWVWVSLLVLSILFVGGIGLSFSYRAANRARSHRQSPDPSGAPHTTLRLIVRMSGSMAMEPSTSPPAV